MTNEVAFTNNIGQVIQPGEDVVIVTTGYGHNVNTCKGKYLGMHKNGGAQCMKQVRESYLVLKATEELVPNSFWTEMRQKSDAFVAEYKKNNPGRWDYYSQPEYKAITTSYYDQVETRYHIVDRRTTLQRNRIYKIA